MCAGVRVRCDRSVGLGVVSVLVERTRLGELRRQRIAFLSWLRSACFCPRKELNLRDEGRSEGYRFPSGILAMRWRGLLTGGYLGGVSCDV